ncbi:MAG: glycosyltransferase family 2 protein [Candidatus Sulfotelmatobacter sp.]
MTTIPSPIPSKPSAKPPQVSVVIPAYNAAAYVAGTLDSVFAQTFADFEVVLVNDGSPDTDRLEQELQPYLSLIRYFRQANRGPSAARNLGIREAKGSYVAFLDADDLWLPQHLSRQVERLENNKKLGLVYSDALHLRGDTLIGTAFERVPQSGEVNLESLLSEQCTINTSSVVVLRSALLQAGLFDESMSYCEDFDLWLRLAAIGTGMEYAREVQVGHRVSNGLAASRELMKRGRARAYQKFAASAAALDAQRGVIEAKLKALDFEIHLERAKERILTGSYGEALSEVRMARTVMNQPKLRWAELGLRYFPAAVGWTYRAYTRRQERSAQRQEANSSQQVRVEGKPVDVKGWIRQRAVK